MPWKYTEEYYREYTRTSWNESAEAYVALMRNLEPFRSDLVARLNPRPGEKVLDLGTGPGEPAITIAERIAPSGAVVGVDLSEKMVSIAERSAKAQGVHNAEFRAMDCSALTFPDAMFDAAVSCFGFQIFTDPEKAARETCRVLKPGGRAALAVWSTGDKVPFLHAIIGPMLEHAEPDETGYIPTPYETGGPGEMVEFLKAAGFGSAAEERVRHSMVFADADHYLKAVLDGTPIGHSLREEELPVQEEVLRKTRKNLEPWQTPQGLAIPAECVLVLARK
ncbi:MAG: methyltransferase domain-containing protein [Thermoplasmata archaeon]|nr:methyltransferase domain-containing protein [Thermoplasmata archaeon]